MNLIIISFIACLLAFVVIGVLSALKHTKTADDYLLAGHSISPFAVALSAVSTNNSAYMFVGMIGYTYTQGITSIWLMVGWIFGDFLTSLFVHKRLRFHSEANNALTYVETLSRWQGIPFKFYQICAAVITILFLGTYAAAQLKGGSKALSVLFHWNYATGSIIGAGIVLLYCFASGIRATIWTDVAQGIVMLFAMLLLFIAALDDIGGFSNFFHQLKAVSPHFLNLYPQNLIWNTHVGFALFMLGWIFAGIGVIGQPHIMTRFMTLNKTKQIRRVRFYYYSWYIIFYLLTIGMGLAARLLLKRTNFDAELALPLVAQHILPEVLIGLILAALFAALMSTADSQILTCSSAITRDIFKRPIKNYYITKLATTLITLIALTIALTAHQTVFGLVLISWSTLGSCFAPLLILLACQQRVPQWLAVLMLITAIITVVLWHQLGLQNSIYEIMPGIIASLGIFGVYKVCRLILSKTVV